MGSACTGELWSLLLYSAVESGCFGRCMDMYKSLQKMQAPSQHDFVNMVQALAHFRDISGFEELVADLRCRGLKFDGGTRSQALVAASSTACCFDIVKLLLQVDDES